MSTRCFSQAISNTSLSPVGLSVLSKQAGLLTMGSSSSVAFPVYFDRPVACWTLTPLLQWRDRVGFAPSFPIILVANCYARRNLFPPMKLSFLTTLLKFYLILPCFANIVRGSVAIPFATSHPNSLLDSRLIQ